MTDTVLIRLFGLDLSINYAAGAYALLINNPPLFALSQEVVLKQIV